MDPILYSAALGIVMLAALSIMTVAQYVRCPVFILVGGGRMQEVMSRAINRFGILSLLALGILPIEGSLRLIDLIRTSDGISQVITAGNALHVALGFIVGPVIFGYIFRVLLVGVIRGRRKLARGMASILVLYIGLVGASLFFSAISLINL